MTVADPGFPRGGGGCKKLLFGHFSPKTAWNWKNLDLRGASLAPFLRSANAGFPRWEGCWFQKVAGTNLLQWQILDFPVGGANSKSECANLFFANFLPKTAWKWNNLDPPMYYLAKFSSKVYKIHKGLYFNLIWREFVFIPPDGSIGLGWIMIL